MSCELSLGTSTPSFDKEQKNQDQNYPNNAIKTAPIKAQPTLTLSQAESEIKKLKRENKLLKKQLKQSQAANAPEMDSEQQKEAERLEMINTIKMLSKQVKQLKKKDNASAVVISKLECKLQETKLESDEIKNESAKLKLEINKLENQRNSDKDEGQQKNKKLTDGKRDDVEDAIKIIGDILETESEELNGVSTQRSELLRVIHSLQQCSIEYEDLICKSNRQLEAYKLEANSNADKLNEAVKQVGKEGNEILTNIIKLNPVKYQEKLKEMDDKSNTEKIIALFNYEVNSTSANNNNINNNNNEKSQKQQNSENQKKEQLTKREMAILGQLENAVQFIKTISESANSPQTQDEKEFCIKQVKQIRKFIDEQGQVNDVASIFENDDPESQIQTFFDFVSKEDIHQTPIREVYTLFKGVLGINKLIFSQFEEINVKSKGNDKKVNKLKGENNEISNKYSQLREKIDETAEKLRECIDDPSGDFFAMIDKLIQDHEGIMVENDDQWQTIENLNQAIVEEREKSVSNFKMSASEPKKDRKEELKKAVEKYKKANAAQKAKISKLNEEIKSVQTQLESANSVAQKLKADLRKVKHERQIAENNTSAELQNALGHNAELSAQITEMREKQSESESCSSVFDAREKVLNSEINKLKQRINQLEDENMGILTDFKDRNSALSKKYEQQLNTLNSDLNETRKMLSQAQIDISNLEKNKTGLQLQIAKLKLADRTKELKLSQMTEHFNSKSLADEANIKAQLLAQKAKYDLKIKEKDEENNKCCQTLKKALKDGYDIKLPNEVTLIEIADSVSKAIKENNSPESKELIKNATKVQAIYGSENEPISIIECFNNMKQESENYKNKISDNEKQIADLQKVAQNSQAEIARCNQTRMDLKSWQKWALNMYRRLTVGSNCQNTRTNLSAADIRETLGETLIKAAKQRPYKKKNELLILQKELILSTKAGRMFSKPSGLEFESLRPFVIFGAFNIRLLNSLKKRKEQEKFEKAEPLVDSGDCEKTEKRKPNPIIPLAK